jgi:23S rRNA pseudouridine955/2504/2580 synthase
MAEQNHNQVSIYQVPEDRDGQRLDNLLLALLKGVPRSWVYRVIRKGQVRINGSRCKAMQKVRTGDQVRIPPVRTSTSGQAAPVPAHVVNQLRHSIIYQDDHFLVIDKPSGLAVHGGSGLSWGAIEALREVPELGPLELVHRIDRETSGCLVLARGRQDLVQAQQEWKAGQVDKRYLCLMKGKVPEQLRIDAPLNRNATRGGERTVQVDEELGKPAVTTFCCLESGRDWSYCEAVIETGRTHQIRVHAQHAGFPLAADGRYGDAEFNRQLQEQCGLKRLFLHCAELAFHTPGGKLLAHAPLPPDLREVLDLLGGSGKEQGANQS